MSHVVTFRDQRGKLMWNVPQRNGCKNWGGGGASLTPWRAAQYHVGGRGGTWERIKQRDGRGLKFYQGGL